MLVKVAPRITTTASAKQVTDDILSLNNFTFNQTAIRPRPPVNVQCLGRCHLISPLNRCNLPCGRGHYPIILVPIAIVILDFPFSCKILKTRRARIRTINVINLRSPSSQKKAQKPGLLRLN
jgi:hypothetical protein